MSGEIYYVTTPIYYVNDSPHLGHAYTTVAADVMARFMRLDGRTVRFLTGTDEHGQKIEKAARAAGIDPQEFCDRVSRTFRDMSRLLNISNDDFIRTTETRHIESSQAIWRSIASRQSPKGRDNIYLGKYDGWYAVRDEAFYDESELTTGPDGKKRAPSGAEVDWVVEPSYFFRLSDWQEWLIDYYERHPGFIGPSSRRNEVMSFVKGGLHDLSISRTSCSWGIPVPEAPGHVMYVWLDALTNYITAVGYPDTTSDSFREFWPANLHLIGKDIVRFHCVYWPAFLAAADLALPERVFAHGWWTVEGEKMSKSLGNFIPPKQLVDQYGVDAVRYFMLRELPFGNDGDFSHRAMVNRINGDLANDFGNLAQRVLSMIQRYCDGVLPAPSGLIPADRALLAVAHSLVGKLRLEFAEQSFHRGLEAIWQLVGDANRYVDEMAPWALKKSDPSRLSSVLYTLAEVIRHLAVSSQPVMPEASAKLLEQLAIPADQRNFSALANPLAPGVSLPKPEGIFPRFVEEK